MKKEELFERWKRQKQDVTISGNFSADVMQNIHAMEQKRVLRRLGRLFSDLHFLPNVAAQIFFALGLTSLGIFRILYVSVQLLMP